MPNGSVAPGNVLPPLVVPMNGLTSPAKSAACAAPIVRAATANAIENRMKPLFQTDEDIALGREIIGFVVEPAGVGKQQPVILHLLAPPVAGTEIALFHRLGGDVVDDRKAMFGAARRLHVLVVVAREVAPFVV